MIIFFVICSLAGGACVDHDVAPIDGNVTPFMCMVEAQERAALYLREHPGGSVARYGCRLDREIPS